MGYNVRCNVCEYSKGQKILIHVERASMDDLPDIWAINEAVYAHGDDHARARLLDAVEKRSAYVAKEGFSVLGYAVREATFFGFPLLADICTHPNYRRQGVARALVAYLEKTNPADRLFASVPASNEVAKHMLQNLNYRRSGMIYNLNPAGETTIIFVHILTEY